MDLVLFGKKNRKVVANQSDDIAPNANVITLRESLAAKQKEMNDAQNFYAKICNGWEKRRVISMAALVNTKNLRKDRREILVVLQKKAKQELNLNEVSYKECRNLNLQLLQRIEDIDTFLNRQKLAKLTNDSSLTQNLSGDVVRAIQKLVFQADALIEIKKD